MISTENRAKLDAIFDGLTQAEYIDAIWKLRDKAYDKKHSTGKWPFRRLSHLSIVANQG